MSDASLLDDLTRLISDITGAFTTAFFFREPGSDRFRLVAYSSLSKHINEEYEFSEGEGFWGWVAKHRRQLSISPFTQDYRPLDIYRRREDIKSFLAVPLEKKPGVLSIDSTSASAFTDQSSRLLTGLARMAESLVALTYTTSAAEQDQHLFRLLMRIEAGTVPENPLDLVLEDMRTFFRANHVFWASLTQDEGLYSIHSIVGMMKNHAFFEKNFSVDEGLVGWVFRKRQMLSLEKVSIDSVKSFIFTSREPSFRASAFFAIPAPIGNKVRGVLGLIFPEPRQLSIDEAKTLRIAASLLETVS